MAGHSHAKNVMHKKNAQDAKKAKLYVKISRLISVAVKLGNSTNPELNSQLKYALKIAQQENVPKHVIQKAIENNSNKETETIFYEAYFGPIAILIQVNCKNRNKSASVIREIINKNNGKMANINSVLFLFKEFGIIECEINNFEDFLENCILLNSLDVKENIAFFNVEDFYNAQLELEKKYKILNAEINYFPQELIDFEKKDELLNLIEKLQENEEVEACWHNCKL